jgi:uncharacterized membrane protein YdjX (TVP38/TMEM64 family)
MSRNSTIVLLVGFGVLIFFGLPAVLQDWINQLIVELTKYIDDTVAARIIFTVLAALSVMLGPFTSAPIVAPAVAVWGEGITLLWTMMGWTVGNSLAYVIGKYLGYPAVRWLISPSKLERWSSFVRDRAALAPIIVLRLTVPSEIGYVFGILQYPFLRYLIISVSAELPFAILLIYAGQAFISGEWRVLGIIGIVWIFLISLAVYFLRKAARSK